MPSPETTLAPEQQRTVDLVVERAEQACRYALKHQDFNGADAGYISGWETAVAVCEGAIRRHVMAHIEKDIANGR